MVDRSERCAHRVSLYDYVKFLIPRKNLNLEEVKRLYLDEHLTASQIGEKFGISKQMVLSRLRRIGVRRTTDRGRSSKNFRYPYPAFGYRVVAHRLVPDRRELAVARMIVELRDRQGMTWADIVRVLDGKSIKTRRKKPWTSIAVRRVHKRWSGKI